MLCCIMCLLVVRCLKSICVTIDVCQSSKRSSVRVIGVIILCTSAVRNDDDDVIILLYRVQPSELKKTKKFSQTFNSSTTVIPNEAPRLPLYQQFIHSPTRLGVTIYKSDFILYCDPRDM